MHHFFIESSQKSGDLVKIEGKDVNHMKNVLRMAEKEKVTISDGVRQYLCEIQAFDGDTVFLHVLDCSGDFTELPAHIYLFQGLPKSDKMDLIVQKAVELGVHKIIPVVTKRTIVKLDEKKAKARNKRWQAIAESAAKQSGRLVIPKVGELMTYEQALLIASQMEYGIIPYECATGMQETKKIISGIQKKSDIAVFIGPEGGFEESEVEQAKNCGILPITLGKRILRTETAGLTVLSILMYELEQ